MVFSTMVSSGRDAPLICIGCGGEVHYLKPSNQLSRGFPPNLSQTTQSKKRNLELLIFFLRWNSRDSDSGSQSMVQRPWIP